MNFIKNNMKVIIAVVITMLLTGSIVGATVYQYQASDIKYGNTTVQAAVGDLYTTVSAQGSQIKSFVGKTINSTDTLTCPSGKVCLVYIRCNSYSGEQFCNLIIDSTNGGRIYVNTTAPNSVYSEYLYLNGGQTIQFYNNNTNVRSYLALYVVNS